MFHEPPHNNLAKIYNARNDIYAENVKLKLCTCAQSMTLATHSKFQLAILIRSTILVIYKFRENILESSRNISETSTTWRALQMNFRGVPMGAKTSQITSLTIVYSIFYSNADQSKHQSSASLAFVWGIHRGPHKWPVTRKMFPFGGVIMKFAGSVFRVADLQHELCQKSDDVSASWMRSRHLISNMLFTSAKKRRHEI